MKNEIPLHTTNEAPQEASHFTMIFGSIWRAYDSGEITPDMLIIFCILYRLVNPYYGRGITSYQKIVSLLQRKVTSKEINYVNKCLLLLRDVHKAIWFPEHSGRRDFMFVIDKYKLVLLSDKHTQKWVCVEKYMAEPSEKIISADNRTYPESTIEPLPSQSVNNQSLRRSSFGSFEPISSDFDELNSRGSQIYND